ncbi:MAG: FAD-linked oxidase C-terminal domain-containing protein, partial [Longimicrobiales bacterium]|nr:FAD-linked oxidase C-terminal domain-containing protein [Longimicrobiales bacterium]
VPPSRLPDYLAGLGDILAEARTDAVVFGHAGDGNVHVNPLVDVEEPGWRERVSGILDRTVDLVAHLGGTLAGEHGDGRVRAPYLDRIWSEEAVRSFRAVKDALDPDNLLNPGVVLPVEGREPLSTLYGAPERR